MTHKLLLIAFLIAFSLSLVAQNQINNPGFEAWEDVGIGTDEPTHWNSIKTSDNELLNPSAPVVWGRSTDAHSGMYSLRLFNVATFGIVASGTITNGQAHTEIPITNGYVFTNLENELYHTVFTRRPDSLVGWYKCSPASGDFATVKFVLHKGYLALPGDETNIIATAYIELPQQTITQWTRFSTPFIYVSNENPEYFLSVITSGNGYDAVLGSEAWYDDFAFVYNSDGIDEQKPNSFHAYQHGDALQVETSNINARSCQLSLINMTGQTIFSQSIPSEQSSIIPLKQTPKGLYLVVLQYDNHYESQKIVIQ